MITNTCTQILPLTITDFPKSGNNNDWIKICDHELEDCCKVKEFDTKDCSNFNGCANLIVEAHDCEDGKFLVDLDFNFANAAMALPFRGTGFEYGTFNYNDLFITFGPLEGDCETDYEFVVKDVDDPNAKRSSSLGKCAVTEIAISMIWSSKANAPRIQLMC